MDFGLQLFGCAKLFRASPVNFINSIAEMGYRQVEPCISFMDIDFGKEFVNPFWSINEIDEFSKLLKSNSLALSSCHAFGDMIENIDVVERMAATFGIKQMVIGCPRDNLEEQFDMYSKMVKTLAGELSKFGVELWIHNNDSEIRLKINDISFYEAVLQHCNGEVGAQVDVGWVQYAGEDPVKFIQRIKPFIRSVHYKDLKKNYDKVPKDKSNICLGDGILDVRAIYEFSKELGVTQLIDQDSSDGDLICDLARSISVLNSLNNITESGQK